MKKTNLINSDTPKENDEKLHYDYRGIPLEENIPYIHIVGPGNKPDPKNIHICYFDFTSKEVRIIDEFGNMHTKPKNVFKKTVKHYIDPISKDLALQRAKILRKAALKLEEYAISSNYISKNQLPDSEEIEEFDGLDFLV